MVLNLLLLCLSALQLPNGVTQSHVMYQDRFGKLQEHLRQLALLFRKLRLLYERCVEMTSDLQEAPMEVRLQLDPGSPGFLLQDSCSVFCVLSWSPTPERSPLPSEQNPAARPSSRSGRRFWR